MAEPFTIYKLTILYMLSKAGFPLSNTQISNFFLEQEYTDYFRVQEVIGDLVDANLIHAESTHSNTQYSLTSAGKETLGFFKDKLNDGIENDVQGFFEKNKLEFRQENSILADYYKTTNQKYAVRCQVRSDGNPLIDLTLCVTTKEQAEAICNNWKKKSEDVYAVLMDTLLQSAACHFFFFCTLYPNLPSFFPRAKYSPWEYMISPVPLMSNFPVSSRYASSTVTPSTSATNIV